jgi:F0F1-type ATP synthase gamma subunit
MVIGDRGVGYLKSARSSFEAFPGIQDDSRYEYALSIRDHLVTHLQQGTFGALSVVYAKPDLDNHGRPAFNVQRVVVEEFIPCTWVPKREGLPAGIPMWWESHPGDVLYFLMGKWVGQRLNQIFALNRLAEMGARAVHLEGSYQELQRLGKRLNLQYQRARHEIIDRSMREIFAAQILSHRRVEAVEGDNDEEASAEAGEP